MNERPITAETPETEPPRLIASFASGFNTVANNIHLLLLPLALDLLLWFGPHLRLKNLLMPLVTDAVRLMRETSRPETLQMLDGIEEVWQAFLEHYNLLSVLSTFPLGVPAMMSGQAPLETPVGDAPTYEISSYLVAVVGWLLLTLVGLALGSLYFASVARSVAKDDPATPPIRAKVLAWQTLQVVLLVVLLAIVALILFIPALVISSILALVSPLLAWGVMLGMSFIAIWLLMPLIFSPHGIFTFRQNVLSSMLNSARMVRFFLPGTGLFVLITIVLYQGLGVLWRTAPDNSWMSMVGIAGHAFISTGLLAASFIYYRSGQDWVQWLRRRTATKAAMDRTVK